MMTDLRYPIGKLKTEPQLTEEQRREMIDQI